MKFELQKGSRSRNLAFMVFAIMAVFIVRLFYLQIIQHDYYTSLADDEQITRLKLPAKRGVIYGLDGATPVSFVINQTVYTVFADPQVTRDDDKIVEVINRVAGGNARKNLKDLLSKKQSRYQILATSVTRLQAELIKSEDLRGVSFQEQVQRVYPEGSLAAQVLGFVDYSGQGRYGVESGLNDRLSGKDGVLQSVTDVSSVPLSIGDKNIRVPAKDGDNIVLSIDRNIQSHVEQALQDGMNRSGAKKASAIVIDPRNGKIMAMANLPSYNPQDLDKVTDVALFNNNIISAPYEPGSVMKTFMISTGIDKGIITPQSTYVNTDYIQVEDRTISNATKGQTGTITIQHALNWSLNTGMVTVAQRLGDGTINRSARDIMYDYYHNRFRLDDITGVELAGEQPGLIISPEMTEGNAVRYSNMSFGQGLDLTMLGVATSFSSVVNGGKYYQPTVLEGVMDAGGKVIKTQPKFVKQTISPETSSTVKEMLRIARSGTFLSADKSGYKIGGKTGTSQVIVNGEYSDNQTVASYVGYGGAEEARYVIMVQVSGKNEILGGSADAGPIFTDISNWMLDYLRIQPKG